MIPIFQVCRLFLICQLFPVFRFIQVFQGLPLQVKPGVRLLPAAAPLDSKGQHVVFQPVGPLPPAAGILRGARQGEKKIRLDAAKNGVAAPVVHEHFQGGA